MWKLLLHILEMEGVDMKKWLREDLKEKMELWIKWIFYGSIYKEYEDVEADYKQIIKYKEQLAEVILGPHNSYSKIISILSQQH